MKKTSNDKKEIEQALNLILDKYNQKEIEYIKIGNTFVKLETQTDYFKYLNAINK